MKKKIENRQDVQVLVRTFYERVLNDEMLGPFFSYVKKHHWEEHLNVLDTFWSNILFFTGGYEGNPLEVHKTLHHFKKLEKAHFDRWLQFFNEAVDELFYGEKAELARQRAFSIATIMQLKILEKNAEGGS
jgi:hemoglobin